MFAPKSVMAIIYLSAIAFCNYILHALSFCVFSKCLTFLIAEGKVLELAFFRRILLHNGHFLRVQICLIPFPSLQLLLYLGIFDTFSIS